MGMAKVGFDIVTMRIIKLGEWILKFDIKENIQIDIIRGKRGTMTAWLQVQSP